MSQPNDYNNQGSHGTGPPLSHGGIHGSMGSHGTRPSQGGPHSGPHVSGGPSGPIESLNRPSPWVAGGGNSNQWNTPMAAQIPQNSFGYTSPQANVNNSYGQQVTTQRFYKCIIFILGRVYQSSLFALRKPCLQIRVLTTFAKFHYLNYSNWVTKSVIFNNSKVILVLASTRADPQTRDMGTHLRMYRKLCRWVLLYITFICLKFLRVKNKRHMAKFEYTCINKF